MSNENTSQSIRKISWIVMLTSVMMGFACTLAQNYATYSFTDLAKIDPATMSMCMFVVSCIATAVTLVSGAIVAGTRSKMGRFRPWLILANLFCVGGGFLIFYNAGDNVMTKAVIISIGYLFAMSMMDFTFVARNGLLTSVAGPDNEARNKLNANNMMGGYLALCLSNYVVVPLVAALGRGNETRGFLLTQLIFAALVMGGGLILSQSTRAYDPDNRSFAEHKQENVKFSVMVKAVVTNRLALIVLLCDLFRTTGYAVLSSMMVYQCTYVLGDMRAMSYTLALANVSGTLGSFIAPKLIQRVGGRKKAIALAGLCTGAGFLSIGLLGRTTGGFIVACSIAFFCQSFVSTIQPMMYIDAGEYWLHKTGDDTRPYLISMYNVAVKVSLAISSLLLGVILSAVNFQAGTALDAAGAGRLTWIIAAVPAIGYLMPLLLMQFHNVSDKEMGEIIKENAEKLMGQRMP